jgi:hypothetical protein
MAVFVASVFFTMAEYAAQQAGSYVAPMRPDSVMAIAATGAENSQIAAKLTGVSGVKSVVAVREVSLSPADMVNDRGMIVWVAPCRDVLAALDLPTASCGSAGIHINISPDRTTASKFSIATVTGEGSFDPLLEFRPKASQLMPLMPAYASIDGLPDAIIDPEVFAADIAATGSGATNPAEWIAALPVSRVYATTDGTVGAGERVRAASQGAAPTALVVLPEDQISRIPQMAEVSRIVDLGLLGSLLLAGCSLAVATMTGLLERRREYTFLRAAGMPVFRLRALVLLQAGVPLVVVSAFSALLGVAVTQAILRVADAPSVPLPDVSIVWLLGASLAAAMMVVVTTLPAVDGLTKPTSLRSE